MRIMCHKEIVIGKWNVDGTGQMSEDVSLYVQYVNYMKQ